MSGRYVSFVVEGDRYCVPVDQVLQIVRPEGILEVPKPLPYVRGVINLRGDVIPVVSLRARLGVGGGKAETSGGGSPRARIIVIRVGNRSCGLTVDEVREIVEISDSNTAGLAEQHPTGAGAQFVRGTVKREDVLFHLLDLQRVLSAGKDLQGAAPV